jgi:hypothetical protein
MKPATKAATPDPLYPPLTCRYPALDIFVTSAAKDERLETALDSDDRASDGPRLLRVYPWNAVPVSVAITVAVFRGVDDGLKGRMPVAVDIAVAARVPLGIVDSSLM